MTKEELFLPCEPAAPPKPKKIKEIVGASETEIVNQLCTLQGVTVFYELFSAISEVAQRKGISIYVYRRDHGERFKHRYYWGIFAVRAENIRAERPKDLTGVVASIQDFPYQVNPHRSSKQYQLLQEFLQKLTN